MSHISAGPRCRFANIPGTSRSPVASRPRRVALIAGLTILMLGGIPPASSGGNVPEECGREINRRHQRYLDTLTTVVARCRTGTPPSSECRLATQARQADGKIARARARLFGGIAARCGGANRRCEIPPGDGDVALAAIDWDTGRCVGAQGRCHGRITTCDDVATCLACVAEETIDQGLDRAVYEPLARPDGAASCQRAVSKEAVRFLLRKARVLGKCNDALLAAKPGFLHGAPCPQADLSGRTLTRIERAEQRFVRTLCKRCGGGDDANGDGRCDSAGTLDDIVRVPYVCPDVLVPESILYPTGDACREHNPVTTLDDYVGCLSCMLEFMGECAAAAGRGDPHPTPRYPAACHRPRALDLVIANVGMDDQRCRPDASGGHRCENLRDAPGNSKDVAVADLNHDGHADLVFARNGERSQVCLGHGLGNTTCRAIGASGFAQRVAIGLVDADEHPDLVFALALAGRNRVCLGDGHGEFTCSNVSADTNETLGVALGHINDDEHLDAVFANASMQRNRLCLGGGDGTFTCQDVSDDTNQTAGVAIGNLNDDAHADLVFGNIESLPPTNQRNRVCLGDALGGFTCRDMSPDTDRTVAVALGDIDDDGALDVVLANDNQQRNRVCFGDNAGSFACADVSDAGLASSDVVVTDVDGDGHLDAAFANAALAFSEHNRLCRGDGTGTFACEDVSADVTLSRGIAAGNL